MACSLRSFSLTFIVSVIAGIGMLLARPASVAAQNGLIVQQLAAGDRVQVTVFQQPEFSGDFIVDMSGAIILPLIGAIPVQDLTIVEAEQKITQRLADGFMERPVVSMKISEQRPVYILGDVRSPGTYPYRYGASVLSAVALAGGLGLSEQVRPANQSDFLQADERVKLAQVTHRALYIRRARLEVQRGGGLKVDLPQGSPYTTEEPDVARILMEEQEILSVHRAGHEQTLRLLRDQRPRLQAEIASVRAQTEAEERQLQLLQEHIADYNKLVTSGLARRYTIIELQREEARHKGNLARFAADVARLDISIGEIGVRIQEVENEYMRRTMAELQETRTRLQELEITMPLAREIREMRLQQSQDTISGAPTDTPYTIAILRSRSGKDKVFQADLVTRLAPGDIVEIRRKNLKDPTTSPMPLISGMVVQAEGFSKATKEEPLD